MVEILAYMLVTMFGSGTWMTINAIWVELSLYTNRLPEGWSLPSYLAAIIQLACLLTLVYSIAHRYTRINGIKAPLIFSFLIIASFSMLALAFVWERTLYIFGKEHSIALMLLTFAMSLVCAASNLFFLPYMAAFHPAYMTAYFVGMSFSSLVPSILKLIQGVGNYICTEKPGQNGTTIITAVQTEPLFQVQIYNLFIFLWMCVASISFLVLHLKYGRNNGADKEAKSSEKSSRSRSTSLRSNNGKNEQGGENEQSPLKIEEKTETEPSNSKSRYWIMISMLALVSAEMNTIVPSIQSYATLAYSMITYHLALTISNISHPAANFLPIWIKPRSLPLLLALVFIGTVCTAFIFLLALQSPNPLFRDSFPLAGSSLSIGASVVTGFLCSYLRTHLIGLIRSEHTDSESALFWCGFFMQIGSFIGACAMFPLVNYYQIFHKRDPCSI